MSVNWARPVLMIVLGTALAILAITEAWDVAICPIWFRIFAIGYILEWSGERIYRKNKGE